MDPQHADNRVVPRFSKENVHRCYIDGVINSDDFDGNFRLNLNPKLPYEAQKAPFPRACKPNLRAPLGPRLSGNGNGNGNGTGATATASATATGPDISVPVLCAEVRQQEVDMAALSAKLAHAERELVLMRKVLRGFVDLHMLYHDRGKI
jgi:hypothetical protein